MRSVTSSSAAAAESESGETARAVATASGVRSQPAAIWSALRSRLSAAIVSRGEWVSPWVAWASSWARTQRRWRCSSPGLARIVLVVSSQSASVPAGRQASMMRIPSWLACVSGLYGIWFMKFSELPGALSLSSRPRVVLCCPVAVVGNDLICRVRGEAVAGLGCCLSAGKNLSSQLSISKGSRHLFSHGDFALCPLNNHRERLTEGIRQGFRLA